VKERSLIHGFFHKDSIDLDELETLIRRYVGEPA
jgi:hypothetical protein